jgi:PAS domain S-box-containing protein
MQNEELRQVHLELEAAHDQYVDLYDFAPVGYFTLDGRGHVTRANLTAAALLGLERKNLVGQPFASFVAPGGLGPWKLLLSQVQKSAGPHALDLTFRRKGGVSFDGHLHCQFWDGPDTDSGVRIVLADNSAARKVERALQERDAKLRAYFESPAFGIAITSQEKGWLDVNDRICAMLGYSRAELSHLTWLELTHPDDVAPDTAEFNRLLADEKDRYALDKRFIRKDGTVLWAALSVSCVRRPDRSIEYFVALLSDVSERKDAEEERGKVERRFRTLAEESPVGVYETDAEGRNVYLNRAGQAIVGLSQEEARGAGWHEAIHPGDRDRVLREWSTSIEAGQAFSSEYRFQRATGQFILAKGHTAAIRDPGGRITGFIGVVIDISETRALQAQLALASRLAAMGTLVAGVAHEINNPLAAVLADQEMALTVVEELRSRLRGSAPLDRESEARHLDDVVEELGDAQLGSRRIERIIKELKSFGRPDMSKARIRLADVVEQAMHFLPATVGHVANVQVENDGAADIVASLGQMEQVVVHLVTNAAKATEPGRPGVIIVRTGPGGPGMARLEVIDHGTGIARSTMERIFEPFFTTGDVGTGMGLGLAVSHAIVMAHGGTLTVESEVGKGSTFRMELPAAPAEA